MKKVKIIILLCITLSMVTCKENPVDEYGDNVIKSYKRTEQFSREVSLKNIQRSINAFYTANNRYPNDLTELEGFMGTKIDINIYNYDHSTGIISIKG